MCHVCVQYVQAQNKVIPIVRKDVTSISPVGSGPVFLLQGFHGTQRQCNLWFLLSLRVLGLYHIILMDFH